MARTGSIRILVAFLTMQLLFAKIACVDYVIPDIPLEEEYYEQKKNLSDWRTVLHLLFCPGKAMLLFHPPPAFPQVHLLDLEVRVICVSEPGHDVMYRKQVFNPSALSAVDNSSGLARVDIPDTAFACKQHCMGYRADLHGLHFNDSLYCDCETSGTMPGCIYYPNGTVVAMPTSVNCMAAELPPELKRRFLQQANCTNIDPNGTTAVPLIVTAATVGAICFTIVSLIVACTIWLLRSSKSTKRLRHGSDEIGDTTGSLEIKDDISVFINSLPSDPAMNCGGSDCASAETLVLILDLRDAKL